MEQLELDFREWKQVPCFEGAYELRNDGLLYSYPRQGTKGGEFVAEYPSELEASKQTGINSSSISLCCKGIYKTAGGSIWKYKEVA